jgi:hypothetical protein
LALRGEEARPLVSAVREAYLELDLEERLDLIDTEHDAALKSLTMAEAQRIADLVPWLGDCALSDPPLGASNPALSFLTASMSLQFA